MKRPYFPSWWYLSTVNKLEQATLKQIADFLDFNYDHVRQKMREAAAPPDGSPPFFNVLIPLTRLKQVRGAVPLVYGLSKRSKDYLVSQEEPVLMRHSLTDRTARPHILAVNEVLVNARKLQREIPWLGYLDYYTEAQLFTEPLEVWVPPGVTYKLSPDLWLDFKGKPFGEYTFCVEVNLTKVTQKRWRRKVEAYLNCVRAYKERFGTSVIQVLVIVATRDNFPVRVSGIKDEDKAERQLQAKERAKRLKKFIAWTEKELEDNHDEYKADMFLFTDIPLDEATPEELFLQPRWHMPFSNELFTPIIKSEKKLEKRYVSEDPFFDPVIQEKIDKGELV
jgi:Replication-relaxation